MTFNWFNVAEKNGVQIRSRWERIRSFRWTPPTTVLQLMTWASPNGPSHREISVGNTRCFLLERQLIQNSFPRFTELFFPADGRPNAALKSSIFSIVFQFLNAFNQHSDSPFSGEIVVNISVVSSRTMNWSKIAIPNKNSLIKIRSFRFLRYGQF